MLLNHKIPNRCLVPIVRVAVAKERLCPEAAENEEGEEEEIVGSLIGELLGIPETKSGFLVASCRLGGGGLEARTSGTLSPPSRGLGQVRVFRGSRPALISGEREKGVRDGFTRRTVGCAPD